MSDSIHFQVCFGEVICLSPDRKTMAAIVKTGQDGDNSNSNNINHNNKTRKSAITIKG